MGKLTRTRLRGKGEQQTPRTWNCSSVHFPRKKIENVPSSCVWNLMVPLTWDTGVLNVLTITHCAVDVGMTTASVVWRSFVKGVRALALGSKCAPPSILHMIFTNRSQFSLLIGAIYLSIQHYACTWLTCAARTLVGRVAFCMPLWRHPVSQNVCILSITYSLLGTYRIQRDRLGTRREKSATINRFLSAKRERPFGAFCGSPSSSSVLQ